MEFMPWRIAVSRKDGTPDVAAAGLFSAVLKARGLEEPEAARAFLEEAGPLYDPMLLPDMDKAVERVRRAMAARKSWFTGTTTATASPPQSSFTITWKTPGRMSSTTSRSGKGRGTASTKR